MTTFDTSLRRGFIVSGEFASTVDMPMADIGITDGRIAAIGPDLEGGAREEIDCKALTIFPGVIDAHVHFNEPGRTEWEGFATGSHALAAGGATVCIEMPLNAHPP